MDRHRWRLVRREPRVIDAEQGHRHALRIEVGQAQRFAAREFRRAHHRAGAETDRAKPRAHRQRAAVAGKRRRGQREEVVQRDRQRAAAAQGHVEMRRPQEVARADAGRRADEVTHTERRHVPFGAGGGQTDRYLQAGKVRVRAEHQRLPRGQAGQRARQEFREIGADTGMAGEARVDYEAGHREGGTRA